MKKLNNFILLLFTILFSFIIRPSDGATAAMTDYCINPPFVSSAVPPNVMIMLSIETPMQGAAHPDVTCTGDPADNDPAYGCSPSSCRTTVSGRNVSNCYDNTKDYYGYFDPSKCYSYTGGGNAGRFIYDSTTSNHQCSGSFSGNFLNWSTMMAVDAFRRAMTGGNRDIDSSGNTVLLGARQTLSTGYSWFPVKRIDNASNYLPSSTLGGNTTVYIVRHANGFSICSNSNCTVAESGSGETRFPTTTGTINVLSAFNLRVNVCDTSVGLESFCNQSNNKPEGVIQKYANKMRFGLTSYAITSDKRRDGGIVRANIKWIPPKVSFGTKYHDNSGNVVTCDTAGGCVNPENEINTDGTFISNPDNFSSGNSGLTNYINKFGYESGYKSYDPISEMYYEIVRYFKSQGPSGDNYCTGLPNTLGDTDDGFPVFCNQDSSHSWRDPYIYNCQQSAVVAINDANPWCDKRVPGTAFRTSSDIGTSTACRGGTSPNYNYDVGDPTNLDWSTDTSIDVKEWTRKVGLYEFQNGNSSNTFSLSVSCELGGSCPWGSASTKTVSNLGNVAGTFSGNRENSYYISGLAYYAHTNDLRSISGTQILNTYMIDTQETASSMNVGKTNMLYLAAKFGGFEDKNGTNANGDLAPDLTSEWDKDGDGLPDNYFLASDPTKIEDGLKRSLEDILRRASSGTAASVLASGQGSGATLAQAIFYPKRLLGSSEIDWTGTLQNYWYYIDPRSGNSSIREDTVTNSQLILNEDYIVQFFFDQTEQRTKAYRFSDSDGDGDSDSAQSTVYLEDLQSLWESGEKLWSMDASSRAIKTNCSINTSACTGSTGLMDFSLSNFNSSTLRGYIQASDAAEAEAIIRYIRGENTPFSPPITGFSPSYRGRSVTLNGVGPKVWKLGDIVNSTPKIMSWVQLNSYDKTYNDSTYTSFIQSTKYKKRGMVFTGANDGMLHAFKLGLFKSVEDGTSKKAILCNDANDNGDCDIPSEISSSNLSELGKEQWAFIPKNSLPYLKYLADNDYCHLYYVDGAPFIFDASIKKDDAIAQPAECTATDTTSPDFVDTSINQNYWGCSKGANSWRTILIGSTRLGGACKATTYNGGYGVNLPTSNNGYSSYFALDITEPSNPILLWEFSNPDLGFSTSGPGIVRINARTASGGASGAQKDRNGKWFVVLASGPTGPIDTDTHQFMGYSDQSLKLFILDLKTGRLLRTIDSADASLPSGDRINNAFGGSLIYATIDYDLDYQDDALYLGYTKSEDNNPGATTKWTQGGVIRLITREDLMGDDISPSGNTALNPDNWLWSHVAKDIGPVTSSVAHLAHYPTSSTKPDAAYLFFGTGRFFYKTTTADDASSQRSLFGIKEPCLEKIKNIDSLSDAVCDDTDLVDSGDHSRIGNATTDSTTDTDGWYINLDTSGGNILAERVITDPLATTTGAVFFTTYAPNTDICSYGGSTYIWALKYDTGGSVASSLKGEALLQVSTGAIVEVALSSAFTDKLAGGRSGEGRRTGGIILGMPPPGPGITLIMPPKPINKILHIRKK